MYYSGKIMTIVLNVKIANVLILTSERRRGREHQRPTNATRKRKRLSATMAALQSMVSGSRWLVARFLWGDWAKAPSRGLRQVIEITEGNTTTVSTLIIFSDSWFLVLALALFLILL
uniref:Uncharacterized protein n=1 Tax=Sphaerodactylus townsendi TaxID=933632 RepID=A0ACB8GAB4_9SAUR